MRQESAARPVSPACAGPARAFRSLPSRNRTPTPGARKQFIRQRTLPKWLWPTRRPLSPVACLDRLSSQIGIPRRQAPSSDDTFGSRNLREFEQFCTKDTCSEKRSKWQGRSISEPPRRSRFDGPHHDQARADTRFRDFRREQLSDSAFDVSSTTNAPRERFKSVFTSPRPEPRTRK